MRAEGIAAYASDCITMALPANAIGSKLPGHAGLAG
jgi:hypothetical protein